MSKALQVRCKVLKESGLILSGWDNPGWVKDMSEMIEGSQGISRGKASGERPTREQVCSNSEVPGLMDGVALSGNICDTSSRSDSQVDTCKAQKPREGTGWQGMSLEELVRILDQISDRPTVENLIYILQKCRKEKDLEYAKRVHAHIRNHGLEAHRAVGNYIVPMLVESGSISEAQEVFDRLVHRNEHSWTSLICGYSECGKSQQAINLYQKMQEDGVYPSSFTLVPVLKACAALKDIERGQMIHVELAQMEFERDLAVGNTLVSMYAKCGSLSEAQKVFEQLPVREAVSWTALIAGYADNGLDQKALECFEHMQQEKVYPDTVTLVCVLKACGNIGALDKGREMHMGITKIGFESYPMVHNTLVGMYAKCGSLSEAQDIFYKVLAQDCVSWNALITGYVEHGYLQEAQNSFQQLQLQGFSPNAVTFVCLVRACFSMGSPKKGQAIHTEITRMGFERQDFIHSSLVDMYAKFGSVLEAQEIFDKLPVRNVVSWTALIAGYAEHGFGKEALRCFEKMQSEGISSNAVTFVCVLKACGTIRALEKGREIHMKITQRRFEREIFLSNTLVDMYAKCGSLSEAQVIFDKMPVREFVSWTALLAGFGEHGSCQEALKCFGQMQLEGIFPDVVTYVCVLKACCSLGAIDMCREKHMEVTQYGFENDSFVGCTLLEMYTKCGSLSEAQEIFDKLRYRDLVAWNALIAGYVEFATGQEVLKCYELMQLEGISPNAITFISLLKSCYTLGVIDEGRDIHTQIMMKGFERDLVIGSTLVGVYVKCGSISEAQEVFDKLPVQETVPCTTLIAGYAEHGNGPDALKFFEQIQLEGISPDAVTFICVLKACGSMKAVDKGHELHAKIAQKEVEGELSVGNALVDMYAKSGSLSEAQEVFARLPIRDVVSWNSLMASFSEHRPAQEVLNCFEQMQLEGISPNALTYVCILKACGSIGALAQGQGIHMEITKKGFEGYSFIGSTLVDMYAKCGSLSEAQDTFAKLLFQDVVSWNAMITGCAINNEEIMALQCFKDMQEQGMEPDAVTFTSLLTACSHARMLCKGQEYFRLMKEKYNLAPIVDHYTCMVDLFARSGHLWEAEKFIETLPPCLLSEGTWRALLAGCKTYGEAELGLRCFQQLVKINPRDASSHMLMADIYARAGRWNDVFMIEGLRKHAGAKKKPATALIEVNKKVHEFVVGNNERKEILSMLEILSSQLEDVGHVPNVDLVLRSVPVEEKGTAMYEHVEKLAIAFGLLSTPQGQTLRVTKNLKMCSDCHNVSKIISKVQKREIIIRDIYCVHQFKDGLCSCGDNF